MSWRPQRQHLAEELRLLPIRVYFLLPGKVNVFHDCYQGRTWALRDLGSTMTVLCNSHFALRPTQQPRRNLTRNGQNWLWGRPFSLQFRWEKIKPQASGDLFRKKCLCLIIRARTMFKKSVWKSEICSY